MQRVLIVIGVLFVIAGVCWSAIAKLPIGRLPGIYSIERPGFRMWIPITTMLVVSAVVSAVLWLIRRF